MRIEKVMVLAVVGLGCAIRLDSNPPDAPDGGQPAPLSSCTPLAGVAASVTGRLVWVRLPDGRELVVAGDATVAGERNSYGFVSPSPAAASSFDACLATLTPLPNHPIVDLTALAPGDRVAPLSAITTATDTYLFFSAVHADGLAADGVGVARWDAAASRFTAPVFLWTADRPSYGSGAALDGAFVYLFGGQGGEFLSADMFVARVAVEQIAVPGAYQYWGGGGTWVTDPDRSVPFAEGGTAPSVAWDVLRGRWLLAYTTPLATEISVRAGLGPSGPWSLPVTLGRCALPAEDPGAFCGDVVLYPSLPPAGAAAEGDEILLVQGAGSFDRPAGVSDDAYAFRLVHAAWPSSLP